MPERYFTQDVFKFLRELENNNERDWWEDNKDRYVTVVREPALEFINDFETHLKKLSPYFVADSRTVGGSLMRPYRDTRFSKDKTPYKTNVGIQFRHAAGKDVHAPGFYLHLESASSFAGVGLWRPDTPAARAIRQSIHDDPIAWRKAIAGKRFTDTWSLEAGEDERLKRLPKEFDPTHPFVEDLKRKSFVAGARLSQKQVTASGFDTDLAGMYQRASGFAGFLCSAVGLPY